MEVVYLTSPDEIERQQNDTLQKTQKWATKAFEHSELYFNLLISVDPKFLKLTPIDDLIYYTFRAQFPKLNVKSIDEATMKSESEQIRWKVFCEQFKNILKDYNFGTWLRCDCSEGYSEVMLVPRVQFLAIELARNREGFNDELRKKFSQKDYVGCDNGR